MIKNAEQLNINNQKIEPQTPSEIAEQAGLNQKTVQTILFDLIDEREDVKMKKIGRYRLF